ncbi:acetylornithine deacetylase [Halomonas nitroreducens]|uniref:Acetylornithine deacetylase n=1 Tax=Halomonas nitroreducens TaxID=447425 RepID=A0A3S0HNF4_9GAMM|nr:acetylornithine deacetylase [Halomonas nitroreducens]RTR00801.1 acetylornithine deacetylase [Halomonas nitroreducens]
MSQDTVVDLLAELVAFDTTSHRSNLPLIAFVEAYLARHGVASRRVPDDTGEKANLYATIGPVDRPGVMLSGHTDTVPVTGQAWSVDPFRLTVEGERLYGRGTADMKGFLAAMLGAVPALVEADLAVPVHLAFSHDEEVGCLGVRSLLADLAHQPVRPAACLVGEPTSMRPATAHKGKLAVRLHVRGKACHSGMAPEGVNAIHVAARLATWVEETAVAKATRGPFDVRFAIPHTTLQVGTIQGGAALNIVPQDCRLDIEIRNVAEDDPEALLGELMAVAASLEAEMRETHPEAGIQLERLSDYPGLSMADDHALVDFILALLDERELERIGYGTEGGLFQHELGIPTLVCGPGSMAQGHQPDESVTRDQLARCEAFLSRLSEALSGPEARRRLAAGGLLVAAPA